MNRRLFALAFSLGASVGAADAAAPTRLEALATVPGSETTLDYTVGSLASTDASARIVALELAGDRAAGTAPMGGVRFDLMNNSAMDEVYLDVAQVKKLRYELHGIAAGLEEMRKITDAPYRTQGTGDCWMPAQPIRILCPEYYVGPDGFGLALGAYSGHRFMFPDRTPADLIALIDSALKTLGDNPAQR